MHGFRVGVLKGFAVGIAISMEIFRRKEGKKYMDGFRRMSGNNKVQEEAVLQYTIAHISKLDATQTKYPALKLTISKNIPAERWRFIET